MPPSRFQFARNLASMGLCFACGVAITVAVAWLPIVWYDTHRNRGWGGPTKSLDPPYPITWLEAVPQEWPSPNWSIRYAAPDGWWFQFRCTHVSNTGTDTILYTGSECHVVIIESGWPLYALRQAVLWQNGLSSEKRWGFRWSTSAFPLPLRPMWPGFLLNVISFSVIPWLMFRALFALRCRSRRRRGLCIGCAYDRRSVPTRSPCPECGRPIIFDHR